MNDLQPFRHGEEGTHSVCGNRLNLEGALSHCCICQPHDDCNLNESLTEIT